MTTLPHVQSPGEALFALHCKAYGLFPESEWEFAHNRKWRFDYVFPDAMVAVEIEGGTWKMGRRVWGPRPTVNYERPANCQCTTIYEVNMQSVGAEHVRQGACINGKPKFVCDCHGEVVP